MYAHQIASMNEAFLTGSAGVAAATISGMEASLVAFKKVGAL